MGTVYRALDRDSGLSVALKVMHESGDESRRRFDIEARALAELSHPHVVRYVTSGVAEEGQPFLVMEWLEGQDLAKRLSTARLSTDESLTLARLVAEGLGAAHALGIVHRDIKPTNLFLVGGDVATVKIVDFGLARLNTTNTRRSLALTRTGMIVGTPGYMSPEQANGDGRAIDARSDVFSLGAVLYECLAGKPPFQADNFLALFAKLLLEDAPRLAEARPDLPPALDGLLRRMLAKDPAGRPASGLSLGRELLDLRALGTEETAEVPTLRDEPESPTLTDNEARLVSVLAIVPQSKALEVDPSGSTQRTPADILASVRTEVAPLGARVFELANGAIVVTLQGAGEPMDRAGRAARSALRLRALLPDAPLALATGRAEENARLPVGDVVDRVARLLEAERETKQSAAGVRIDEATRALLDARFEVQTIAGHARLVGERAVDDVARTFLGKPSPFVGRERELRMARDLVEAAYEEERSQAILLVGAAGIGKSRLREELLRRIIQDKPSVLVLRGRGDLLGKGSAFSLFGSALLSLAQARQSEGNSDLCTFVQQYLSPTETTRVLSFVGEMLGLVLTNEELPLLRASRQDPSLMKEKIREAVLDLLSAMAKQHPVLLTFDDVQWGDAASMRLLDTALRELSSLPFVVVLGTRPEVFTLFPRLSPERTQEIRLGELPRKAGEKLIRHALGDAAAPELIRDLIAHAAGNPFYLEELLRAVAEGRGERSPETVLGMVEARLETLDPSLRRVLRAASIYGESFPAEGLLGLIGNDETFDEHELKLTLESLVEREILVPRREARLVGTNDFAFRHSLLQEGAYATLTERDRGLGHRLAGFFLQSHGERDQKVLATHFDLGQESELAIGYYARAAEHALASGDDEAAVELSSKGLLLGANGERAATLYAIQTDAYSWSGDLARSRASAEAALALATPGSRTHCRALGSAISNARASGNTEERIRLAEALARTEPSPDAIAAFAWAYCTAVMPHLLASQREAAERHILRLERVTEPYLDQEPAAAAWVKMTRAFYVRYVPRDFEQALRLDEEALHHFESIGEQRYESYVRMQVGLDLSLLGAFEEAAVMLTRCLSRAEPKSATAFTARAILYRSYLYRGLRDEERSLAKTLLAETEAQGEPIAAVSAALLYAEFLLFAGDLVAARRVLEAYAAAAHPYPFARMMSDSLFASLALAEGRPEEALALAERTLVETAALRMYPFFHEMTQHIRARALFGLGRDNDAEQALLLARDELLERASRIKSPHYRKSFLENVPAHASILADARALLPPEGA